MKELWQIWADEYWRARKKKGHDMAIVGAVSALAFHMEAQSRSDYPDLLVRFKETTDAWAKRGGDDWDGLRESLRHQWTDHELKR